jgi:GntR family transcriptional regulator
MPIRVDDPRPPYLQVADELRQRIAAGELEPGDRLPSTRQLAETYGIATMTVQNALRVLRDEGLVVSHQGRGVYVQDPKNTKDPSSEPSTTSRHPLDQALADLREANRLLDERLSRLEARNGPDHDTGPPDPGPAPDVGPEP